jgi:hypothetical protein
MKICPIGAKLFHRERQTDGQTDMTKLIVAFAIALKKVLFDSRQDSRYTYISRRFEVHSISGRSSKIKYSALKGGIDACPCYSGMSYFLCQASDNFVLFRKNPTRYLKMNLTENPFG